MSLLNLNPASMGASLTTYAIIGAVCLAIGGLGGYKAGSAIMYQKEDVKLDKCVDTISAAERQTLDKLRTGQVVLTAVISDTSGKVSDSEAARAKVLKDSETSEMARLKLIDTVSTPSPKPKTVTRLVVVPPKPGQSTPVGPPVTEEVTVTVEYVVPQATIRVINQLLEISNETGLYAVPIASPVDPASELRVSLGASASGYGGLDGGHSEGADELLRPSA